MYSSTYFLNDRIGHTWKLVGLIQAIWRCYCDFTPKRAFDSASTCAWPKWLSVSLYQHRLKAIKRSKMINRLVTMSSSNQHLQRSFSSSSFYIPLGTNIRRALWNFSLWPLPSERIPKWHPSFSFSFHCFLFVSCNNLVMSCLFYYSFLFFFFLKHSALRLKVSVLLSCNQSWSIRHYFNWNFLTEYMYKNSPT